MKAKIAVVVEYDLDPSLYGEGVSPQEMIDVDIKNFYDDPYALIELGSLGDKGLEISGEAISE